MNARMAVYGLIVAGGLFLAPVAERVSAQATNSGQTSTSQQKQLDEPVLLRWKFEEGEVYRWTIRHNATTMTRISGNQQQSSSVSESTKRWEVASFDPDAGEEGIFTIVHSVENVRMSNELPGRPPVSYDSTSGEEPPPEFAGVRDTVGVTLAEYKVTPFGHVEERISDLPPQDLGMGDVIIPLPKNPVNIGAKWSSLIILPIRLANGEHDSVRTRQQYELLDVRNGIAIIDVKTVILKPNVTPRMRSQLMQQMTFGKIRFDIERGCLRNQHIEWDEQVIGFDTADSLMKYVAEYIETFDAGDRTAEQTPLIDRSKTESPHTSDRQIRLPEDKPLIRR